MSPLYEMGHKNECCVAYIMSVQQILPLTFKCDHDLGAMNLGTKHRLIMVNISAQSFQSPPRKGRLIDGTQKKTLFFTFDL